MRDCGPHWVARSATLLRIARSFRLSLPAKDDITHLPPAELAASILEKEKHIAEIMGNIRKLLAK